MRFNILLILFLFFFSICYSQTAFELEKQANSKFEKKDYKGAITDYTKAIEINSEKASIYINRGIAKADKDFKEPY